MLSAEQNDLITRTGPGTAAGALLRRYWQPAALVDELAGNRPVKPVRLLGEDIVAFKDDKGRYGLIGRQCPHRGTDLAYGRLEDGGLRCAFHGWLFDVDGQCLQTPADRQRQSRREHQTEILPGRGEERHPVRLSGRRRGAGVPAIRLLRRAGHAHLRASRA